MREWTPLVDRAASGPARRCQPERHTPAAPACNVCYSEYISLPLCGNISHRTFFRVALSLLLGLISSREDTEETRRCVFMDLIHWAYYPSVAQNAHARDWLETQAMLGLAHNTVQAYGRGANDYLAFCERTARPFIEATKADIVAYLDDMTHRSNPKGENIRYLHSGVGLANSTMQQRLTVVRSLYDYLIDERIRLDQRNPVGKGKFTPGRAFAGKRERGILRHYEQLPWLPGDDEWDRLLEAAKPESLRNRLMLLFAYDGALRRSELVALQVRDLSFPHQQISIRPEIAKNGRGRVVMYGDVARDLLQAYLAERDDLYHRLTTHTPRHLRLTDLARCGMEIHTIAQYAGHRNLETTKLDIKLSGRETAERVR